MDQMAWLGLASGLIGGLIQVLKSGAVQKYVSIPRGALPWIALSLGLAGAFVQYFMGKAPDFSSTVALFVEGALSGLVPVAVHELGTKR